MQHALDNIRKISANLGFTHLFRVPFVMKQDETLDVLQISLFSSQTEVFESGDEASFCQTGDCQNRYFEERNLSHAEA